MVLFFFFKQKTAYEIKECDWSSDCALPISIPGERIGWMAVHPEAESVDEFLDGAILCNRILGYVNAPALMQRVVREIHDESVDVSVYKRKRDMLCAGLKRIGYDFQVPDGTFYLFPKAPGGDDLAAVSALQEQRILTVPGRGFGLQGYFRIAFCVEDEVISRSLDRKSTRLNSSHIPLSRMPSSA